MSEPLLQLAAREALTGIALEGGIVLRRVAGAWCAHGVPLRLEGLRGRRPFLAFVDASGTSLPILIDQLGQRSPFMFSLQVSPSLMWEAHQMHYFEGALMYHFAGLVRAHEVVGNSFKDLTRIEGWTHSPRSYFSSHPEPYYELDALLTVIRRAYDTLRYPLWKLFGSRGTRPRSLSAMLEVCPGLPPDIADDLRSSWDSIGTSVTAYRDCLQHYTPVDFGLSSMFVEEAADGVWGVTARIPDNPESKSRAAFSFSRDLNALRFCWESTLEARRLLLLVGQVMESMSEPTS